MASIICLIVAYLVICTENKKVYDYYEDIVIENF